MRYATKIHNVARAALRNRSSVIYVTLRGFHVSRRTIEPR